MLADLALLSGDITTTLVGDLGELTAPLTVCDGRIVYEGE